MITDLTQDWGNRPLGGAGGHKQNPVHTRNQDEGKVPPQETDPDLPGSVQESLVEVGRQGSAAGSGALNTTVRAQVLSKEGTIIFITYTTVWP